MPSSDGISPLTCTIFDPTYFDSILRNHAGLAIAGGGTMVGMTGAALGTNAGIGLAIGGFDYNEAYTGKNPAKDFLGENTYEDVRTISNLVSGETVIAGASGVQAIENARRADEIGNISQNAKATDDGINLKPQNLMNELANSGVKYNPDEVVAVTKTKDGKLLWLENGNTKSGLTHIMERHADDFASQGINNIPQLLNSVLETTPVKMGSNPKGLFADYVFNGNTYRIAYGTNGYIVSFYPID